MLEIIKDAKEIVQQFIEEYVWVALKGYNFYVIHDEVIFYLTEKGFVMTDVVGIETYLSEMSEEEASLCARLIPEFLEQINRIK